MFPDYLRGINFDKTPKDVAKDVPYFNIQLMHALMGSMVFCTPEGANGTRGEAEGAFAPEGVQNPWTPITACNNCFVIPR